MRVRTFSEALQISFLCRQKKLEVCMFGECEAGGMKVAPIFEDSSVLFLFVKTEKFCGNVCRILHCSTTRSSIPIPIIMHKQLDITVSEPKQI
jgi:hypothetical protein